MNWINPDEHTIDCGQLCAHGFEDIIFIDHRFSIDADVSERREHGLEPAGLWRGTAARRFISPPEDSDAAETNSGLKHGKRLRIDWSRFVICPAPGRSGPPSVNRFGHYMLAGSMAIPVQQSARQSGVVKFE